MHERASGGGPWDVAEGGQLSSLTWQVFHASEGLEEATGFC